MAQTARTLPAPRPAARSNGRSASPAPQATPQVDYLPFATQAGANVIDQASYAGSTIVPNGYTAGIAASAWLNKTWRQASVMSAALANFIANSTGNSVLDDGNVPALVLALEQALSLYLTNAPTLGLRQRLTADATWFVSPGGSDATGNGSSGNPWQTPQHAVNWVLGEIDFGGSNHANIQLADGTYTAPTVVGAMPVGSVSPGQLVIRGNPANNSAVTLNITGNTCVTANTGSSVLVRDLRVMSTVSGGIGGNGLGASYGGQLLFQNINFGPCGMAHLYAVGSGAIVALGNYAITGGGGTAHAFADLAGYIQLSGTAFPIAVTLTGTPAFSGGFAYCGGGQIYADDNTFSGAAAGPHFGVLLNGVIFTGQPANLTYFPGSTAGTIATGGQYG